MIKDITKESVEAFKALIETYRSITDKDIESVYVGYPKEKSFKGYDIMHKLTGFGKDCSLCEIVMDETGLHCEKCIYSKNDSEGSRELFCTTELHPNKKYFEAIAHAKTKKELVKALSKKVNFMQNYLARYSTKNKYS